VADVDRDQHRRQRLRDPRHLQPPAVDAAQAGDPVDQRGHRLLVLATIAADQDVLVEWALDVGEHGRADRVQPGDDAHTVGNHLLRLLGRRPLPDAEHPRRPAGDRRRQRDRRVDHDLPGAQHALEVCQGLRLVAKRDRQDDEIAGRGRDLVRPAGERPVRDDGPRPGRRLLGPQRIPRADRDSDPRAREAHRQAETQGAGAADDADRVGQDGRV
jgi:hypothetical protein